MGCRNWRDGFRAASGASRGGRLGGRAEGRAGGRVVARGDSRLPAARFSHRAKLESSVDSFCLRDPSGDARDAGETDRDDDAADCDCDRPYGASAAPAAGVDLAASRDRLRDRRASRTAGAVRGRRCPDLGKAAHRRRFDCILSLQTDLAGRALRRLRPHTAGKRSPPIGSFFVTARCRWRMR